MVPFQNEREDYALRQDLAFQNETESLLRAQKWYKRDFDRRLRKTGALKVGETNFLDVSDLAKKTGKISHNVGGSFIILDIKPRTDLI